jgi:hypothetical protein
VMMMRHALSFSQPLLWQLPICAARICIEPQPALSERELSKCGLSVGRPRRSEPRHEWLLPDPFSPRAVADGHTPWKASHDN